jgi:hypothetical protein
LCTTDGRYWNFLGWGQCSKSPTISTYSGRSYCSASQCHYSVGPESERKSGSSGPKQFHYIKVQPQKLLFACDDWLQGSEQKASQILIKYKFCTLCILSLLTLNWTRASQPVLVLSFYDNSFFRCPWLLQTIYFWHIVLSALRFI